MEDKIKGLVSSLTQKTKNKETNWERIGRSEQFTLTLDNGMISIDKFRAKNGNIIYLFSIVNGKGDKILSLNGIKKDNFSLELSDYDILKKFHEEVSRAYFKVDETIDGLLNEVKKDGEIGKEVDDLPF